MLRTLRNTAALIVAASFVAAPLTAQTTAPAPATPAPVTATPLAPAPAAPAATAPAAPAATAPAAVPQALADLGITSATVTKGKRDWQRVEGTLPGGAAFRAILDTQGQLRMLRAQGDAALPADLIERLVPQAVRNSPVYGELAQVGGIAQGPEGFMVFGKAADGQMVRAGFSPDGALQKFGRGDGHDKMGKRDHDKKGDRDKKKGDHDKRKGDRHKHDRDQGQHGMTAPQGAALSDDAVRNALAQAGYTHPGDISRDGPRVTVPAVNPEGENVTVTVNPRGVVVREEAR